MSTHMHTIADAPAPLEPGPAPAPTAAGLAERIFHALNEGAMIQLLSIGHRTGLLAQVATSGPTTSADLARATGLAERYVREWLNGMVTARVIEILDGDRYQLPSAYAPVLSGGGSDNVAVFAQYLPLLGTVEDDIIRCFQQGGGLPYSRFDRFQELMADDSAQSVLSVLHTAIVPLVPGLEERLTTGIRVLDLGCGRGRALAELAERYPASEFTGYDLLPEAVEWARANAAERGLANVRFEVRDLRDFDVTADPEAYDFVTTFDAVHDQPRPANLLRGIARTLKPDGVYLMQDIRASSDVRGNLDHPMGAFLYTVSLMHCMTVSLAQDGDGLGTMWGRELATQMLREAGFREIAIHELPHDVQNDYYVVRK